MGNVRISLTGWFAHRESWLEELIRIFTDKNDVVIDPCAGSGSTLLAAMKICRRAYGFEIKKDFFNDATEKVLKVYEPSIFTE